MGARLFEDDGLEEGGGDGDEGGERGGGGTVAAEGAGARQVLADLGDLMDGVVEFHVRDHFRTMKRVRE